MKPEKLYFFDYVGAFQDGLIFGRLHEESMVASGNIIYQNNDIDTKNEYCSVKPTKIIHVTEKNFESIAKALAKGDTLQQEKILGTIKYYLREQRLADVQARVNDCYSQAKYCVGGKY